jgi:purine nucleosidase
MHWISTDRGCRAVGCGINEAGFSQVEGANRVSASPTVSVLLDMDVGIDDAIAIMYLAAKPDVEIVALGSVYGNCDAEVGAWNALRVLEVVGRRNTPVAIGARKPLIRAPHLAPYVHGEDGLGNSKQPKADGTPTSEHAADQILRLANERPGELTLIAVGPLTNLALALQQDPEILTKFQSTVIMGGSGPERLLDAGPPLQMDANIANDPEGADAVFAAPGERVMVGVNVTSPTVFAPQDLERIGAADTDQARFAWDILQFYLDFYSPYLGSRTCSLHDPLAAGIAIEPAHLTRYEDGPVGVVEVAGYPGQQTSSFRAVGLAPDSARSPILPRSYRPPTRISLAVDERAFVEDLVAGLTGPF